MDVESRMRRVDILIGCGHDLQRPEVGPRPKEHLSRICFPRILRPSPRLLFTTSPILVPDIMADTPIPFPDFSNIAHQLKFVECPGGYEVRSVSDPVKIKIISEGEILLLQRLWFHDEHSMEKTASVLYDPKRIRSTVMWAPAVDKVVVYPITKFLTMLSDRNSKMCVPISPHLEFPHQRRDRYQPQVGVDI